MRFLFTLFLFWPLPVFAANPSAGGAYYKTCAFCHSLSPGVQLTGPSLANLWDAPVGRVAGFDRYSPALVKAELNWTAEKLRNFLKKPTELVPGTWMTYEGTKDEAVLDDLMAFLEVALAPAGYSKVIANGWLQEVDAAGQRPKVANELTPATTVTALEKCGENFHVSTADGARRTHWEQNVNLRVDSGATGPTPEKPAILPSGSLGDRFLIVFKSPAEITRWIRPCGGLSGSPIDPGTSWSGGLLLFVILALFAGFALGQRAKKR